MTTEQLILENAMLRQHIVDNQLAMPEEISTAQPAVSFGRALRNHLEAVAALPVEEVPASNDVTDALERMDALLQPGLGLLAVGDKSATAEASRRDMATIRAALAATQAAPAAVAVPEDWMEYLGFELDAEADGIWQVIEDTGARREATLTERVLWKELTAIRAALAATPAADAVELEAAEDMLSTARTELEMLRVALPQGYWNPVDAAMVFGVDSSVIRAAVSGKSWRHVND